ncbi:MAG: ATPase [Paludibacteraceae bacterium]|jgi:N-acetylglucosamine kinase-like BadF-type ATPase|nr:ATPase [Paludibacteraceae bacterium]MDI9536655.1 ATPase [Bacteroidota bacterium]OQC33574.1 MAG: hypothetical protein BWX65_00967 [Bacteroidetes bacterium ADurb.Bin057]HHT61449.1 ATPase [Bacteroidales bacterium]MBP9039440.1 ATPase [Paludibacteraceae bacterium]
MILIADSGSTKTDWRLISEKEEVKSVSTPGINPFYQTEEEIENQISTLLYPELMGFSVKKIFFYGAGCAFEDKKQIVKNAISVSFPKAQIEIESDLLAAARGLFLKEKGIACILGTGSNSCFYDGKNIIHNVSPLGFILGDEGSGAVLGKKFAADCLKNQLPEKLKDKFLKQYDLTPAQIIESVYKKPFPNRFLAQFTRFLSENIAEPSIYNIVFDSFTEFFTRNIMQYNNYKDYPVCFIGSIAYYFKDVLEVAANELDIQIGIIYQSPMPGLIKYHQL